jgi:heme/copper-type cytochrome/quinol oxidase subunit 3
MAATTTPVLALPSAGGSQPRHVLSLATLFGSAAIVVYYAALVGAYVLLRPAEDFPPDGVQLDQYLGNMLLITAALAAFTVEWGYASVRRGLTRQASTALAVTVGLGVAFLALLAHTFTQAGNFTYRCEIHPSMRGTVNVR